MAGSFEPNCPLAMSEQIVLNHFSLSLPGDFNHVSYRGVRPVSLINQTARILLRHDFGFTMSECPQFRESVYPALLFPSLLQE